MATKSEIKKLLKSGLTGWEAGLLVFEDSWITGRNEPGFLTDSDIASLKAGLKSQQDTQDYNRLIRLYRTADFMERQCMTVLMTATAMLERVAGLGYLQMASQMGGLLASKIPLPVTEKQLQELKARQRKEMLKKYFCMDEVISRRAYTQTSEEVKAEHMPEDIGSDDETYPLWLKAEEEIASLVEAGKLKPVKLDVLASCEPARSGEREDINWWPDAPDWTPEVKENYLQHYLTGQELYKAGLPEWKEEIDTFQTWRLPKEYWLGGDPPDYVAIVQEPSSHDLDKRGHFKTDFVKHWPLATLPEQKTGLVEQAISSVELTAVQIKRMLAKRQVLEELGQVIGLKLEEGTDFAIDTFLKPALNRYNGFAQGLHPALRKELENRGMTEEIEKHNTVWNMALGHPGDAPDTQSYERARAKAPAIIKLEKLKPPADDLEDFRGWITGELGEHWWQQARAKEPRSLLPADALQIWSEMRAKEAEDES